MIQRINHTCIAVHDLDRSVAFYRDILGCEVAPEVDFGRVKCISLRIGGDTLELMKVLNPDEGKDLQRPMEAGDIGNVHIGFDVDNIEEHAQKVKNSNAEVIRDTHEIDLGNVVIKAFYFRDPDGYALQFLQVV